MLALCAVDVINLSNYYYCVNSNSQKKQNIFSPKKVIGTTHITHITHITHNTIVSIVAFRRIYYHSRCGAFVRCIMVFVFL